MQFTLAIDRGSRFRVSSHGRRPNIGPKRIGFLTGLQIIVLFELARNNNATSICHLLFMILRAHQTSRANWFVMV